MRRQLAVAPLVVVLADSPSPATKSISRARSRRSSSCGASNATTTTRIRRPCADPPESLRRGGKNGEVIVPGNPKKLLFERVLAGEMPPPQGRSQKLPEAEIRALKTWIAAGAKWPKGRTIDRDERTTAVRAGRDWWSLQGVKRPEVPATRRADWCKNPIDSFILAKLEAQGMTPAPQADRRILIRRTYFDLLGLPPSEQEVDAFVRDDSPDAYERLISRLLASPHFGEHYGRYWLDLARFAETSGYERDQEKPGAWRYRDWVVAHSTRTSPTTSSCASNLPATSFLIETYRQ